MISAKENAELLNALLLCHIAPQSKQEIVRARKSFKEIRGFNYPVSEVDMIKIIDDTGG